MQIPSEHDAAESTPQADVMNTSQNPQTVIDASDSREPQPNREPQGADGPEVGSSGAPSQVSPALTVCVNTSLHILQRFAGLISNEAGIDNTS